MQIFKSTILFLLFLSQNLLAQDSVIAPFYGSTTHTNAKASKSSNYGLYFQGTKFKSVLEFQEMKYNADSNLSDFKQTNIAMSYSYYYSDTVEIPYSLQYISSSNSEFSGVYSLFVGIKKELNSFNLGSNFSYSSYGNSFLDTAQQITPYISFSFGDYKSLMGTYNLNIAHDYVSVEPKSQIIKDSYGASSLSITQNKGSFQNFFKYLLGDSMFAVGHQGLSIQNFHEVIQESFSFSSKYTYSPSTSLQLSFVRKNYEDLGVNPLARSENILAFLYYKF
jgi:hypothetical protein